MIVSNFLIETTYWMEGDSLKDLATAKLTAEIFEKKVSFTMKDKKHLFLLNILKQLIYIFPGYNWNTLIYVT